MTPHDIANISRAAQEFYATLDTKDQKDAFICFAQALVSALKTQVDWSAYCNDDQDATNVEYVRVWEDWMAESGWEDDDERDSN